MKQSRRHDQRQTSQTRGCEDETGLLNFLHRDSKVGSALGQREKQTSAFETACVKVTHAGGGSLRGDTKLPARYVPCSGRPGSPLC